ncbi:MAG: type I 3-dehydroquinate dehydratase [Candidatus Thorarchaeota archaeon]
MSVKLCVCLTGTTFQECADFVSSTNADLIEHRMDFMKPIIKLDELYSLSDIPIIATCRSPKEGGLFEGNESDRIECLVKAIEHGASFVDIEIDTERRFIDEVRSKAVDNNCRLILSKHYPNETPSFSDLVTCIQKMNSEGPDILKIVVTPESIEDCRSVLQLYYLEKLKTPLIAFGLGNRGRFTRVTALFLGAPFMYVSQDFGVSAASGQISLSDMRTIVGYLS